ncbi:MAG: sugar phosphate isomerase/epimerase family protein [Lentisphaerota bacterium]
MQKIKLSAPDWCFYRKEFKSEDYYEKLHKLGYSAVEMSPPEHWKALRGAGLKLINIGAPGMETGLNNQDNHASLIPEILNTIHLASENDIPQVIIFSGNRKGTADAAGLENCKLAIEKLLPVAQNKNVTLIFEMFNKFDHKDYQADNSRFGFDLVNAFKSANLKILYDIYHMHRMGENVISDITANLKYIAHLHVAGAPKRNFPGSSQEIDYPTITAAVMQAGYKGYWGMEFITPAPFEELEQAARLWERLGAH